MKQLIFFAILSIFTISAFAQIKTPVTWSFTAKKIDAKTYEIHLTANIEKDWHVYSQTTPAGGPVATSINFTKNPLIIIDGSAKEIGKLEQHMEPLFGVDVKQFSNSIDFVQKVKLKAPVKTQISGTVEFMVCNDRECLPPTEKKFSIALK